MNSFFQDGTHQPSRGTVLGSKLVKAAKTEKFLGLVSLNKHYMRHLIQRGADLHFKDDLPFREACKANLTENALFLLSLPSKKPVNVMANNASAFLNAAKNDNPVLIGEISIRAQGLLKSAVVYQAAESAVDGDCLNSARKLIEDFDLTSEQINTLRQNAKTAANDAMVAVIDKSLLRRKKQQTESAHQPSADYRHPSFQHQASDGKASCYLGAA